MLELSCFVRWRPNSHTDIRLTSSYIASLRYSPISNVCIPTDTKYRSIAPMMVPGIYDFVLLGLTLIKGMKSLRVNSGSAIVCLKFQLSPIRKTDVKYPRCSHWFGMSSCTWTNARNVPYSDTTVSQLLFCHCVWTQEPQSFAVQLMSPIVIPSNLQLDCLVDTFAWFDRRCNLCWMGFRIDVSSISWAWLPVLSEYLHRLTSRFFLNLRYIAFHQQQTALGTRGVPSTVSALPTRPTWKQSGRPTTGSIVNWFIYKTTHNSETYSNEEDIQQAESLHLEVIRSQNHFGIMNDVEK